MHFSSLFLSNVYLTSEEEFIRALLYTIEELVWRNSEEPDLIMNNQVIRRFAAPLSLNEAGRMRARARK